MAAGSDAKAERARDDDRGALRQVSESYRQAARIDRLFAPHAEVAFERKERLGEGGMGIVTRVVDHRFGREAALKMIRGEASEQRQQRFLREALITARLDHPSIPPVYEFGRTAGGDLYMLMKVIHGETLADRLKSHLRAGRPTADRPELLRMLVKVCEAVAYAHEHGVVHRDLKPENIMVGRFGEVMVMDWGLARDLSETEEVDKDLRLKLSTLIDDSDSARTREGAMLGTPGYMAPEQARGEMIDGRADIFALGVILTEVLCGESAVIGETTVIRYVSTVEGRIRAPRAVDRSVPRDLNALAAWALEVDPTERLDDALVLMRELQASLDGRPLESYDYGPGERAQRLVKQHPGATLAALFAILLMAGGWVSAQQLAAAQLGQAQATADAEAARDVLQLLEQARESSRQGRGAEAMEQLESAVARSGGDADVLLAAARVAVVAGRLERARELCAAAVEAAPPGLEALLFEHTVCARLEDKSRIELTAPLRRILAEAGDRGEGKPQVLFARACEAIAGTRREEAKRRLRSATELAPDFALAWAALGTVELLERRAEAALEFFNRAVNADPQSAELVADRGAILNTLGRPQAALADLDKALALEPAAYTARLHRARVYLRLGRHANALEDLDLLTARFPERVPLWVDRGLVLEQLGRDAEALRAYDQALAIDPEDRVALTNKGKVLVIRGRLDEGRACFERVLERHPNFAIAISNLASLATVERRFGDAQRLFEQAIRLEPDNAMHYANRARLHIALGRDEAALADYDLAIAEAPGDPELLGARGLARLKLGLAEEALADFDESVRIRPGGATLLVRRGIALTALQRSNEAYESYNKALRIDPGCAMALYHRGLLFFQANQREKAFQDLEACLRADPDYEQAAFQLGVLHEDAGNTAEAVKLYSRCIAANEGFAAAYLNRGNLLAQANKLAEALADYERFLALDPEHPYAPTARNNAQVIRKRLGR